MKQRIQHILLIIVASLGLYANSLKNGFIFDDKRTIVNNYQITELRNLPTLFQENYFAATGERSYRPVVTFTYMLDFAVYGFSPMGFHLTNVLLHTLNGILVYLFIFLLINTSRISSQHFELTRLQSAKLPFLAAFLYIVQPVLSETVNAVSFREDLLVFFFYITALNLYMKMKSNSIVNKNLITYLFSCIAYFIALLSKEMALTFPIIIYCYEMIIAERKKLISILFERFNIGYIAITVVYVFIRFSYFKNHTNNDELSWELIDRFYTIPWLILSYLKVIIFPISLSAVHTIKPITSFFSIAFLSSATIISILLAIIFLTRRYNRFLTFGFCFFLITMFPVYNIIYLNNPFAERYLYLPVLGLIISFVFVMNPLFEMNLKHKTRNLYIILFVFVIMTYALIIIERNKVWKDDYSFWHDTVKKMPNSRDAHLDLAFAYLARGQYQEALNEYNAILSINPNDRFAMSGINMIKKTYKAGY